MNGGGLISQGGQEAAQTCLQCYRKTIAPLVLKCQHFICLNCLKEQLALTKGGLYSEYKCKVCGLFTDLSHLTKVFIDNKSFNIFETDLEIPPEEKVQRRTTTIISPTKQKSKSPAKKKVVVTSSNVVNLADKAEELINSLQVNRKTTEESNQRSFKELFRSQYMDAIDYTKCIQHQRELIFMDKETSDFYCVDCISDSNVKLVKERLIKIKKEHALIKEKSKTAVMYLSQLQSKIELNLKMINEKLSISKNMKKEVKQVVKNQFNYIYNELKHLEAKYEEYIIEVLEKEAKIGKKHEAKNLRMLGIVTGVNKNFNQVDTAADLVANIARWRRISKEYDMNSVLDREIHSTIDSKVQ